MRARMTIQLVIWKGLAMGRAVSVAEAKAHLSELLKAVEEGETIEITRRGKPVASLAPVRTHPRPVDIAWVNRATAGMTYSEVSAVDVVRDMRDARY